ncbi:MAG: extracellular solute-binding protein [Clostridiales bacterium]|nr:extracellular solute-binding protein [Clostridiales bacterium]
MKKLLATLLASAMALTTVAGLTACGEDKPTLTVWAPAAAKKAYEARVADWKKDNEQYKDWTVKFENKAEGEAETDLGIDPTKGADIFFMEAGQIATMESKAYLQKLTTEYSDLIKARDSEATYKPVERDGRMLAFPCTSDNGYFLYYDKEFFDADDVKTLDGMLAKMEGKTVTVDGAETPVKIMFEYDNGYYEVSWFFGTGCMADWQDEDQTIYKTDVSTSEAGRAAARASIKYLGGYKDNFQNGGTGAMLTGFANKSVVAAFSGTWGAQGDDTGSLTDALKKANRIGKDENGEDEKYTKVIGATKLPTFKTTLDNGEEKEYQMGSFVGGKYCGINRYKNNVETITAAMSLANYFCDQAGQEARFDATEAGPSNLNVAAMQKVKDNVLVSALNQQNAAGGYAQLSQNGLWDAMKAFGEGCWKGEITASNMQSKLNDLAKAMAKGASKLLGDNNVEISLS